MNQLRVAVIGTGRMGGAMVGRIRSAGFPVTVYNRTRAKAEAVAAQHDVVVAATPREAVSGADVVVVSLADEAAAFATYRGIDGLVAGLRTDAVVVDASTVAPVTVRELSAEVEASGAVLLDTPVSGSVSTVESGALVVMAGGSSAALQRARSVLNTIAKEVVHLGELGTGAAMKLVVNSVVNALNVAVSEALVLAERSSIDREVAYDVIASGAAGAPFVQYKRESFLNPDSAPVAFALDLAAKDLDLAIDLAEDVGANMSQLMTNRDVVAAAIRAHLGAADLSVIAEHLRT
jgi:3-hydroxyisobutyrate dehydrogenase/2-hydroxy-3-oxopropionate reductase